MELYFFKSKEHINHYLIYRGIKGENPERWLAKLTHIGEYIESGYRQLEIEMGFVFKTDAPHSFLDFLVEHVSTNHIANPDYDTTIFRSWYEFTEINTGKWINEFNNFQNKQLQKTNGNSKQITLF